MTAQNNADIGSFSTNELGGKIKITLVVYLLLDLAATAIALSDCRF